MKAIVACTLLLTCILAGFGALAGPFVSLRTRVLPTAVQGQRVIGGVEGPVKSMDEDARIVRIASGFLGLSSLPIVVTPDTTIAVEGKLGWWGDLRRGLFVRVAYEVTPGQRFVASRVEVLGESSAPAISQPADASAGPGSLPARTPGSTEPSASPRGQEPARMTSPRTVTPEPAALPREPLGSPSASRTSPKSSTLVTTPPSSRPAPPVARGAPPASARRSAAPERSAEEDGGAAVEWLLKESTVGR